jgi:hypothetical protein
MIALSVVLVTSFDVSSVYPLVEGVDALVAHGHPSDSLYSGFPFRPGFATSETGLHHFTFSS